MRRRHRQASIVLPALLLAGCSAVATYEAEPLQEYLLEPVFKPGADTAVSDIAVAVAEPRAHAGFDTRDMLYQERDFALDAFARNRWAESPARMLGPLIVQALENSGRFAAVSGTIAPVQADWRLDTADVRLLQIFHGRDSRVELSLRATLTDTASRAILFSRELRAVVPSPSADPYGGVQAANRAAADVLGQLVDLCAGQIPAPTVERSSPGDG